MSRIAAWVSLALMGCSAPFTNAPYPAADDGGNDGETAALDAADAAPDAFKVELDAGTPEASPGKPDAEASTLDARPEPAEAAPAETGAIPEASTTHDTSPSCTPFPSNALETCPNACAGSCGQPATLPSTFFRASPANYSGCAALATPSACTGCRENFTCACIVKNWTATVDVCGSTAIVATCDDSSGVPVFTCH